MVIFDLPVLTAKQRKMATRFRNFLLTDGYTMLQYSVYVRICNGADEMRKHSIRLRYSVPDNGSIQMFPITERQFETREIILGNYREEDTRIMEQLSIF